MDDKQRVAQHAAAMIRDGMLVGLGTGSTANCFIDALAARQREEGLHCTVVSSSVVSGIRADERGLPRVAMEQIDQLDCYVDGADEVAPDLTLLKGRGADLVREKLLARAAGQFIVLVDQGKLVQRIGEIYPIPIEVVPFAWRLVQRRLESLGATGGLRPHASGSGLAVSSHGSLILDMSFDAQIDVATLDNVLNATPGVVEHGIFRDLARCVVVGHEGVVRQMCRSVQNERIHG